MYNIYNIDTMESKFSEKIQINNKIIGKINNKILLDIEINIPNEQRIRDDTKVNEIIEYQEDYYKKNGIFNFIGIINIHLCDEKYYLVDGQHRYNSIKKLTNMGYELIDIGVELVFVNSMEELKINYKLINKNTPLPEFPENIDKNIPEDVARSFFEKYANIWSASNTSRVRRPHINKNNFQEALGILTNELNIKTSNELLNIVESYNSKISNWSIENFPKYKTFKDPSKIEEKCKSTKLYLGLFTHHSDDYGYGWVKNIIRDKTGREIKHNPSNTFKRKIPKKIRVESWNQNINKSLGNVLCICCNSTEITPFIFEAGHIIPKSKGGEDTVNNLLPICIGCNRSMACMNMGDYIEKYHNNNLENFKMRKYQTSNNYLFKTINV